VLKRARWHLFLYRQSQCSNPQFFDHAHIDHGKSRSRPIHPALGGVGTRNSEQVLDSMDLERERGITISATAALQYTSREKDLQLESHRYSRAFTSRMKCRARFAACEGALLVWTRARSGSGRPSPIATRHRSRASRSCRAHKITCPRNPERAIQESRTSSASGKRCFARERQDRKVWRKFSRR